MRGTLNTVMGSCLARPRLGDAVAVVTGGARGIGGAIVERLLQEGARVAILDIEDSLGERLAQDLSPDGARAIYQTCDVRDRSQVYAALQKVNATFGPLTAVVNNAGIGVKAAFLDLQDADWDKVLRVNLTGAFTVAQEAARIMARHERGSIVNISSVSAYLAHEGLTAYSVSKAGLLALTRMMAFELAPAGIRVNAVVPGTIETDFVANMMTEHAKAERRRRIPLARFGTVSNVADTVAFLLSQDADYITGASVPIDGGVIFGGIRD
jgi:glucose 1-dehydrogenase